MNANCLLGMLLFYFISDHTDTLEQPHLTQDQIVCGLEINTGEKKRRTLLWRSAVDETRERRVERTLAF